LIVTQDAGIEAYFPAIAKVRMHRYRVDGDAGIRPLREALRDFLRRPE
jgi:hypothetical protein